jgi:sporulation protein YlmC with PRC-barrel domain
MRMTLSDLRLKDVINTRDGRSLGKVIDVEFCLCEDGMPGSGVQPISGRITAIIVPGGRRGFHCGQFLRGEKEVIVIPWEMICKIGDDVILVDVEVG